MNNFLQIHDEDVDKFVQKHQDGVRQAVESRVRTVHMIGDVIELFFPRLADTLTVMMGGDVIDPGDMYLTIEDNAPSTSNMPSPAPGGTDGDDIIR